MSLRDTKKAKTSATIYNNTGIESLFDLAVFFERPQAESNRR